MDTDVRDTVISSSDMIALCDDKNGINRYITLEHLQLFEIRDGIPQIVL